MNRNFVLKLSFKHRKINFYFIIFLPLALDIRRK